VVARLREMVLASTRIFADETVVPGQEFDLTLSVTNGTIYYTVDGTDPRLPGGALASSAAAYAGPVPITESVRVKARARAGPHADGYGDNARRCQRSGGRQQYGCYEK
jgi:hypothetical protein